jgi:mutator protein MutT
MLILKRRPDDPLYPGLWGLPSGKVEPGETPNEAMFRELLEETGIWTNLIEILGKCYVIYPKIQFVYHMFRYDIEDWMFLKKPKYPKISLNPMEHVMSRFKTPKSIITMKEVMLDTDACINYFYEP